MAKQDGREACYRPNNNMDDSSALSREQMALIDFSYQLGSYSYTSSEPGNVDEEKTTREEAELLMSLCASSPSRKNETEVDAVPSSSLGGGGGGGGCGVGEDSSLDSASLVSSHRDSFSFICPSLSLETSTSSTTTSSSSDERSASSTPTLKSVDSEDSETAPGELFGRPLTVDDRDALRLSADAMARNVLHSFQKAIDWRIRTWIKSLSSTLVRKEKSMLGQGASKEQLKELLETSEAQLISKLQGIANQIQVSGVGTDFTVLPQRVEETKDTTEPVAKKLRMSGIQQTRRQQKQENLKEEGDYQYTVAHALQLECVVNLLTPAGYSEVTLEVPGTIEGTFTSAGREMDNMTSVVVDLHTHMLAAMVEKACRKVVRASVEATMLPQEPTTKSTTPEASDAPEVSVSPPPTTTQDAVEMMTPPPREVSAEVTITGETVRAALITPRESLTSGSTTEDFASSRRLLFPIPDDLDERGPRRISPQPSSPEFFSKGTGKKASAFPFTLETPKAKDLWDSTTSALVSPPLKEPTYHEVGDNGPSLPMLVEVACRAFRSNA